METVVGMDVHSKSTVYVCLDEEGREVGRGCVETSHRGISALCAKLQAGTRIGLESGTQAFFVARLLQKHNMTPIVIHAGEVRKKATRPKQKDDYRDAGEIAQGIGRRGGWQ